MMTRKDYVKVAEILKNFHENISNNENDFIDLVYDFADMFAEDNPNFQEKKFVQACGLDIL
jgi:hypothetical protein